MNESQKEEFETKRKIFENFKGKTCLILYNSQDNPGKLHKWIGTIVEITETHLLERDAMGRMHLLRLDGIVKISEVREG